MAGRRRRAGIETGQKKEVKYFLETSERDGSLSCISTEGRNLARSEKERFLVTLFLGIT